jgi:hypothetical protein
VIPPAKFTGDSPKVTSIEPGRVNSLNLRFAGCILSSVVADYCNTQGIGCNPTLEVTFTTDTRKTVPGALRGTTAPSKARVEMSYAERYAQGKALREACPRTAHAAWKPPAGRPGAVQMVLEADKGRYPPLLPLRHGRMVRSAFTFYRGSALAMASDLASTPATGAYVQCCGDAHLCNFGGFATPERRILFAINDLDETLPAPWEWDLKRLAASFVVAARDNGISEASAKGVVMACSQTYRESMAEFSQLKTLELWYQAIWAEDLVASI